MPTALMCPKCLTYKTMVRETTAYEEYIRRRRVCMNAKCRWRFTTVEAIVPEYRAMVENVVETIKQNLATIPTPKFKS